MAISLYRFASGYDLMHVFLQAVCFLIMYVLLFRTMSSVRSHAAAGENFFMMILQFLETFVGSMSSGCTSASNSTATWL
jgi:hypothetical protein